MMKTYLLTALICATFLYGCKDSTTVNTSGTGSLVGDLKGRVYAYDQKAAHIPDASGFRVSIEGTNYSAITDSTGFWVIHNLPTRTYSIAFVKEGFDTMKNTSYTFVGGGTQWVEVTYVLQHPTTEVILDAAIIQYGDKKSIDLYKIYGHATDNSSAGVLVALSTTPSFDPEEIGVTYYSRNTNIDSQLGFFQAFEGFLFNNSSKSDTLYVTAYAMSLPQSYFDVQTGRYVQLGLGKQSNVLQIIKK